jgi:UPF0716 protein FxsA
MRVAFKAGSFSALEADDAGGLTLLAGILLLTPGFITDALGVLLLVAPLCRALGAAVRRGAPQQRSDGVVNLPPEQWHRVPHPELPDRRGNGGVR